MPWYWWLLALGLVGAVGVVKGKRTRRKVWRAIRNYAKKQRKQRTKAAAKVRTAKRQTRTPRRQPASPWQPAPLLTPPPVKRAPVLRVQRCSASCRMSRKPASTCDCACGGRDHGRYRTGTAASVRATKYTPEQKRAQRVAEARANRRRLAQQAAARRSGKANGGKPIPRGGKG